MVLRRPINADRLVQHEWRSVIREMGDLPALAGLAQAASAELMRMHGQPRLRSSVKPDGTMVSDADRASAALLQQALRSTGIPVVCEDGSVPDVSNGPLFWLVDPLDGTKEFLAGRNEFSINIALVANGEPVVGMIAIPAEQELFVGIQHEGTWRHRHGVLCRVSNGRTSSSYISLMGHSVACQETEAHLASLGVVETVRCGSAIKFCRLAEGKADIYLRLGQTMEWDTAAGQIIAEEAGCRVINVASHERLQYGKGGYVNPAFLVVRRDIRFSIELSDPKKAANLG